MCSFNLNSGKVINLYRFSWLYFTLLILIGSRCLDFSEYEEIELGNTSACVLSILRVCNCLLLIMR